MTLPASIKPWVRCPECGESIAVGSQITGYFHAEQFACSKGHDVSDWWAVACREIEENFMLNQAYALVGASTSIFSIALKPGVAMSYRFSDNGIPENAKILYVNYTPQSRGGLFPLEIHGNVPARKLLGDLVMVYPAKLSHFAELGDTKVSVMVSWVPMQDDHDSWRSLVDAFEAYANDQYESMIVPANVAVESELSRFLNTYLKKHIARERVESFLDGAATYSHQLNVLLPLVAVLNSCPKLPDHIRGLLNRLRDLRNQIAHTGTIHSQLSKKQAAEVICSALFGVHYVRHISELLGVKTT